MQDEVRKLSLLGAAEERNEPRAKGFTAVSDTARVILLAFTVLLIARVLAMIWVPLTDPTEARYAEIARKMVETGNWVTPQFDYGVPFWAKPPLHTWISAVGIAAFGSTPFAARLGILLTTITTLAVLWLWARTLIDPKIAGVVTLVTASSGIFFVSAAYVQTDMVLTLGVVATMAGFYNGINGKSGWGWMFFLGLAIGLLAKGPVAGVLSISPIFVWTFTYRRWKDLQKLPWVTGTLICALLVLPWYIAAEIATPGFLRYFIIGEHIERFLQPGWTGDLYGAGRAHVKGTIWLFWLIATLPWSPLLPLLIWRRRSSWKSDINDLHVYLLLFTLTPLVFFTAAANILIAYVLPGIPAAAMLSVMLWERTGRSGLPWLTFGLMEITMIAIGITAVAVTGSPENVLPSEAGLISAYPGEGRLAIFGARSFSAEFYSNGRIKRIDTLQDLAKWLKPGDGVLVHIDQANAIGSRLGNDIKSVAEDRNFFLYVKMQPEPESPWLNGPQSAVDTMAYVTAMHR